MAAPSKPNRSWRGALEFEINGVPLTVSAELYSRVKKARNESFTSLAPSGVQRKQQSVDPATGEVFDDALVRKGVKVGKDKFVPMTDEALEQIKNGTKTETIRATKFAEFDSIAWDLAIDRFAVRPNDEVQGSAQALNIVWNGLVKTNAVQTAQVSLTGGHDAILAIYATDDGMWAALLPFEEELYPVPTHTFTADAKQAKLMASYIEGVGVQAFDHSEFVSEYKARRQAAIDAVVAGEQVQVDQPAAQREEKIPDLMAALEASIDTATKKPARKAPARKKVAA
jgi:non-homologous end joining protein Ku